VTRKEMRDQIVLNLGLQDIASYDETGTLDATLQWGTIDLLARTKCVARCIHLQTTAGTDKYLLPHDLLALIDFTNVDPTPKARRDQSSLQPSFTLIRADVLRVEPVPTAVQTLEVWGVKRPQRMSQDTDSPGDENFGGVPDEYQDAILTYALWKMADYADDSGSGQGERYRGWYEGADGRSGRILQIKQLVNHRGTSKLPARKVSMQTPASRGVWVG